MRNEKGSILGLACIILVCLLLFAVPILVYLSNEYRSANRMGQGISSISLAEAGAEMAIWELNEGDIANWIELDGLRVKEEELSLGKYYVQVNVDDPERIIVNSMGMIPYLSEYTIDKTIVIELKKGELNLFQYAVFGKDGVHLESNAIVDSYDSRLGEYDGENIGAKGNIGTSSTEYDAITLASNAEVHGDIHSGEDSIPEDVVTIQGSATVTGDISALGKNPEMPAMTAPEGLIWQGSFQDEGNAITISEDGEYSDFILGTNTVVTIEGDIVIYVSGEFQLNSNCQLNISPGSSLKLYLGHNFLQNSNSQINNVAKDPTALVLIGTDTMVEDIVWNSYTDFYGAVYASESNVILNSNAVVYGAIMAKTIVGLESNARVHYDEALAGLSLGKSQYYIVWSWHQIY